MRVPGAIQKCRRRRPGALMHFGGRICQQTHRSAGLLLLRARCAVVNAGHGTALLRDAHLFRVVVLLNLQLGRHRDRGQLRGVSIILRRLVEVPEVRRAIGTNRGDVGLVAEGIRRGPASTGHRSPAFRPRLAHGSGAFNSDSSQRVATVARLDLAGVRFRVRQQVQRQNSGPLVGLTVVHHLQAVLRLHVQLVRVRVDDHPIVLHAVVSEEERKPARNYVQSHVTPLHLVTRVENEGHPLPTCAHLGATPKLEAARFTIHLDVRHLGPVRLALAQVSLVPLQPSFAAHVLLRT